MRKLFSGSWVYLLTVFLLIVMILYLAYRRSHNLISFNQMVTTPSTLIYQNSDTCANSIYGEPVIPAGDSYIKIIVLCSSGKQSVNTLVYSALGSHPTALNAVNLLAGINSFTLKATPKIKLNGRDITQKADQIFISPRDVLEIKYE